MNISYKEQARRILHYLGEKEETNSGYTLNAMAQSEMERGHYARAIECCTKALHLSEDLTQPYGIGVAHMLLGAIYLSRGDSEGDLKSAQEHFQQAAEVFDHAERRHDRGVALMALGWVILNQWKLRRSLDRSREVFRYYQEALNIFNELNSDLVGKVTQRIEEARGVFRGCLETENESGTTEQPAELPWASLCPLPVVGHIAAGEPVPTEDDITGYASVERVIIDDAEYSVHRLGKGRSTELRLDIWSYMWFITPVIGDSMNATDPPILEGDHVLLRGKHLELPVEPRLEDIVAAVIPDVDRYATLKRLVQRDEKMLLEPESSNPDHQPFELTEEVEIVGVAVAVLKKSSSRE